MIYDINLFKIAKKAKFESENSMKVILDMQSIITRYPLTPSINKLMDDLNRAYIDFQHINNKANIVCLKKGRIE